MHCHLLIPNLFFPPSPTEEAGPSLRLPALETLLARSKIQPDDSRGMEEWLCRTYGIARQADWPVAALTLLADGETPQQHYWLRADPVHLQPRSDQLVLAGSDTLPLSQNEAATLIDALNRHFAQQGMVFCAPRPNRWYLRLAEPPSIRTSPLPEVAGRGIRHFLPEGQEKMRWHAILNEIQMLLHAQPLSEAREARGDMPVNSVWLWGGGSLPAKGASPFDQVWADDPLAQGLARASGSAWSELPPDAPAWLAAAAEGRHLIVLDSLRGALQYGDRHGWREGVQKLEQGWFAPLHRALRQKRLAALELTVPGIAATRTFRLNRADLWKVWRQRHPLASIKEQ